MSNQPSASPPPLPSAPPPKRQLRAIAAIVALLTLFASGFGGYHWWLFSRIESRLVAVRAAHLPLTLAELNAFYPSVAARSNAALVYGRAFEIVRKSKSSTFLEHLDELPSGSGSLPAEIRESMETACQQNAAAFEALAEAAKLKLCRYPVDYTPGWAALLPHLSHLRKCAALEMSRGVLDEQQGKIEPTIECIESVLRFADSLVSEPDLVSVVVQYRLDSDAGELLRWLLNHRQLSLEQLAKLQRLFQRAEPDRLENALIGERCFILTTFDYSAGQILDAMDPGYENRIGAIFGICVLKISGALKKDEIRFLERLDESREALRLPLPKRLDRATDLLSAIKEEARPKRFILTGVLFPSFLKAIEKNAEAIARQRLVLTALAVEQFRITQGRLPDSLDELSPALLPKPPRDPFSEATLRYHHQSSGYLLYSVGPDRQDDGGAKHFPRDPKIEHPKGDIIFEVLR